MGGVRYGASSALFGALVCTLSAAAVLTSFAGARPRDRTCALVGGHVSGERVKVSTGGRSPRTPYDLELTFVSPRVVGPSWQVGRYRGSAVFGGSTLARAGGDRTPGAVFCGSRGETLATFRHRWFVAPLAGGGDAPEAMLWRPEAHYEPASRRHRSDVPYLFSWNYSQELKLLHSDYLARSIAAAARGDSLVRSCSLVVSSLDGDERVLAPVTSMYTADAGYAFTRDGRMEVLVDADGSYQNADMLYLVTNQPSLHSSRSLQLRRTDDIGGNYRGCFCIDPGTGRQLWHCRTGAGAASVKALNLNDDAEYEYLFQCYASENGVTGSGMTDAGCTYVFCVDRWGHILWRHRFCGTFAGASAAADDFTGDSRPEVAVGVSSTRHEHMGSLCLLDGWGSELASRDDLGGVYGVVPFDVDGDGRVEVVAGLPDSTISAFDDALEATAIYRDEKPVRRRGRAELAPDIDLAAAEPWSRRLTPVVAADVDADSEEELVLLSQAYWDERWLAHRRGTHYGDEAHLVILGRGFVEEARCVVASGDEAGPDFHPMVDPPASLKTNVVFLEPRGEEGTELALENVSVFVFNLKEPQ